MRRTSILALALLAAAPAMGQGLSLNADDGSTMLQSSGQLDSDFTSTGSVGESDGLSITASNGTQLTVLDLDPDGNGIISEEERQAALSFASSSVNGSGECEALIVSNSNAGQIAAIDAPSKIALSMVCADPKGLSSAQRAAIAANSALMDRLAATGYGLSDVAGIVVDEQGRGTLYLSAS